MLAYWHYAFVLYPLTVMNDLEKEEERTGLKVAFMNVLAFENNSPIYVTSSTFLLDINAKYSHT
jgi:hypothetical protein